MEFVAKAIYLLNFYSGSSMFPATVWIISGRRNRRKNDTVPAPDPELFFHEHGSSSGALDFHECGSWNTLFSWLWLQLRFLFVFTH